MDPIKQQRKSLDSFCELCYFFKSGLQRSPCGRDRARYVGRDLCSNSYIDGVWVDTTARDIKFYDENDKPVCYQRQGKNAMRNLMAAINRKKLSMTQTYNRDGSSDGVVGK